MNFASIKEIANDYKLIIDEKCGEIMKLEQELGERDRDRDRGISRNLDSKSIEHNVEEFFDENSLIEVLPRDNTAQVKIQQL